MLWFNFSDRNFITGVDGPKNLQEFRLVDLFADSLVYLVLTLADSGFFKNFLYQGGVKSTVSWVFEDLKFKISEGYDQNWSEPSEILNLRS